MKITCCGRLREINPYVLCLVLTACQYDYLALTFATDEGVGLDWGVCSGYWNTPLAVH